MLQALKSLLMMARLQYDKTATLTPGFRLNYREDKLGPGDLTMGLPVPWQADFDACGEAW